MGRNGGSRDLGHSRGSRPSQGGVTRHSESESGWVGGLTSEDPVAIAEAVQRRIRSLNATQAGACAAAGPVAPPSALLQELNLGSIGGNPAGIEAPAPSAGMLELEAACPTSLRPAGVTSAGSRSLGLGWFEARRRLVAEPVADCVARVRRIVNGAGPGAMGSTADPIRDPIAQVVAN